jgi:hypothetical protein
LLLHGLSAHPAAARQDSKLAGNGAPRRGNRIKLFQENLQAIAARERPGETSHDHVSRMFGGEAVHEYSD